MKWTKNTEKVLNLMILRHSLLTLKAVGRAKSKFDTGPFMSVFDAA
jgi:hypothetical protein